jgi:hypothetical protein
VTSVTGVRSASVMIQIFGFAVKAVSREKGETHELDRTAGL